MAGPVDSLLQLAAAIGRGETPRYEHNECYTSGAFDGLLVHAFGQEAFELLVALAARHAQVQETPEALPSYFNLLGQVARQSGTTELPSALATVIASHPDLSEDLRSWYRLVA